MPLYIFKDGKTSEGQQIKPINAHSGHKQPDNFDEILQANTHVERYLKEKCSSEHYQQLSFKYFIKSFLILKLLEKVS